MRKLTVAAMLVAVSAFAGCRKTGDGEYQVVTPDVNVSTDTSKVRTPSVSVKKETTQVVVPKVDVETPKERARERKQP